MEKKINFESLSPNVIVKDVNQTVDYYTKTLGFTLIATVPESGTYHWGMVKRDGVTMMFQTLKSLQEDMPTLGIQSQGSIGTFYVRMTGIDALYQSVKGNVEIALEMRTTFYGMKEFVIKDLNGYYLSFAEEVK